MKLKISIGIFATALLWGACQKQEAPTPEQVFEFKAPKHFETPLFVFERNALTKKGFELGKALFYDKILSKDGTISCASCHKPEFAFADTVALNIGVNGQKGTRNTPSLVNLAWNRSFFFDGRLGINEAHKIFMLPLEDAKEMGESISTFLKKLNENTLYKQRFEEVYPQTASRGITQQDVSNAMTQFLMMLTSSESKHDKNVTGKNVLNETEKAGFMLFSQKCTHCHSSYNGLLTNHSFEDIGLETIATGVDFGRFNITQQPKDKFKFKVPSLRNIAKTSPYMHDGRFKTLQEVLLHYKNPKLSPNLSWAMLQTPVSGAVGQNWGSGVFKAGIPMTWDEMEKIIAYLETLTDENFLNNPIFR